MRIKDWNKFQHFKDRRPPWIKLYRDILDDIEWHKLEAEASKVLIMLWLIASEYDGDLPDIATLAFRLRMKEEKVFNIIKQLGHWIQADINPISSGYQDDRPERERETKEEESRMAALFLKFFDMYPKQRKGAKDKAKRAWDVAIRKAEPEVILAGLENYMISDDVANGFAKGAQAWLNDEGWANTYKAAYPKQQGGAML